MLVLSESHVAQSPRAFDEAWASPASMLILPDKIPDEFWVHARLGLLPNEFRTGHLLLWHRSAAGRFGISVAPKTSLVEQAELLASQQALEGVERALITLSLSEPFALVNQWIWAMPRGVMRSRLVLNAAQSQLAQELSSPLSTLLCLDEAQAQQMLASLGGQRFDGITRICLVNSPDAERLCADLMDLFPRACCHVAQGSVAAMSYTSMRPAGAPRPLLCEALSGVEFERSATGQLGFRSRFGAIAKIDDHGAQHLGAMSWFELPEPELLGQASKAA